MKERRRMNRQKSERYFRSGADRIHKFNLPGGKPYHMRGGIRL